MNSKFELIAGELRATFLGNQDVAASKVIEGKQEDVRGGSGSYLPRARPRHPRAADRAQTNLARNFLRSFFETTRKRCNSNDADSRIELLAGELRAKLLCDERAGSTAVPVNYWARLRCPWAVAGPGRASRRRAERSSRRGRRAGGPPPPGTSTQTSKRTQAPRTASKRPAARTRSGRAERAGPPPPGTNTQNTRIQRGRGPPRQTAQRTPAS